MPWGFDSGIGGLSIAQEIAQHLPNEWTFFIMQIQRMFPMVRVQIKKIRKLTARAIGGCIGRLQIAVGL